MKTLFFTNCDSWLQEQMGTNKLVNSFKYFHPELDLLVLDENYTNQIVKDNPGFDLWTFAPLIIKKLKKDYSADLVVRIDSDSLILDRLDEVLTADFDCASVRNDGDHIGDRDERRNRPENIHNLPNHLYVNGGFVAVTNDDFLDDWIALNQEIVNKFGGVKEFWMVDQNMMNIVFHSGKYKCKILDKIEDKTYYGAAANIPNGEEECPDHITKSYGFNNWASWKQIQYKNNKFYLNDKQIKVLHQAGGGKDKLKFDMFNNETKKYIQLITKFNE